MRKFSRVIIAANHVSLLSLFYLIYFSEFFFSSFEVAINLYLLFFKRSFG